VGDAYLHGEEGGGQEGVLVVGEVAEAILPRRDPPAASEELAKSTADWRPHTRPGMAFVWHWVQASF